VIDAPPLTV